MKIKTVTVDNVKSFKHSSEILLNSDYNFVVGTNGSGKTTLFQIMSSCLLLLIPQHRAQPETYGDKRKMKFVDNPFSTTLPKNYGRKNDPQNVVIEISFVDSKAVFLDEIIKYSKIFKENESDINTYFGSLENMAGDLARIHKDLSGLKSYVFKFKFDVAETSVGISEETKSAYPGIIEALSVIERARTVYSQLFMLGKTKEVVARGFRLIYMGADRQIGFQKEISANKNTLEDYTTASAYARNTDLMNLIFSTSSFDYIGQSLLRIAEQVMYRRWHLLEDKPLESIVEFIVIKERLKEILDLDFSATIPGMPYEAMKFSFSQDGDEVNFEHFSSGEKSLIYFLFTLANPDIKNSFFIIDEAEIHLHGNMQDKLLEVIFKKNKNNNQYFISTHSPKLINKLSITSVLRFYKINNQSQYINFRKDTNLRDDYDIIRLINSQNNEKVFFADKVVLVEGIKDRILIEAIIKPANTTKDIIEVIDVAGKHNLGFYKAYLDEIKVENYTISDFDYLFDIKKKELAGVLESNSKKIDEIIKSKKSEDRKALILHIEDFILRDDKEGLEKVVAYLKSRGVKLKELLTAAEYRRISMVILSLRKQGILIISAGYIQDRNKYSGEIEDYLLCLNTKEGGGESVNSLVEFCSKENYLKLFIANNEDAVNQEIFGFVSYVLFSDYIKGKQLLRDFS